MAPELKPQKRPIAAMLASPASTTQQDAELTARSTPARKRMRLWEIDQRFLNQILGHCLPRDQLTRVARAHFFASDSVSPYIMHIEAVGYASVRNPASEDMQASLERIHARSIARYEPLVDTTAILEQWQRDCDEGQIAGPLWAAMTHKAISMEGQRELNARMHMRSFQFVAEDAALRRSSTELDRRLIKLSGDLAAQRSQHARVQSRLRERLQEASEKNRHLNHVERENRNLRARIERLETAQSQQALSARIAELESANEVLHLGVQRNWALEKSLRAAHEELERMARERDAADKERSVLQQILALIDTPEASEASAPCQGACDDCAVETQERCVLFVGGRPSMLVHYRALAGRLGIKLLHHDGGLEESISRIPDLIGRVDAVVCPTDCVSHSAYHQVKRHCKQAGKPCLLYRGAGLYGFSSALARISSGDYSLCAPASETPLPKR